jgi:CRISPR-associated protein Csm4
MKSYKIKIKPKSFFSTPLLSDTIFGQFACVYKEIYGEKELEDFLELFNKSATPPLVFSDAFPTGYLPKPILKPLTSENRETLKIGKEYKKKVYILKKELLAKIQKNTPITEDILATLMHAQAEEGDFFQKKERLKTGLTD